MKWAIIPVLCLAIIVLVVSLMPKGEPAVDAETEEWANAYVQYMAGATAYSGDGVEQDFAKALEYFQKAVDLGSDEALFAIGVMYHDGNGVPQNFGTAREWYLRAADRGVVDAYLALGTLYHDGLGAAVDFDQASAWFQKAAERKSAKGFRNLALMAYYGEGRPKSLVETYKWMQLAVASATDEERPGMESIADSMRSEMTASQVAEAESLLAAIDPTLGSIRVTWSDRLSPSAMSWDAANLFCAELQDGGYAEWRLPTRQELHVKISGDANGQSEARMKGPFSDDLEGYIFSGTLVGEQAGSPWTANIRNGHIFNGAGQQGYAWCVRTEQP